MAFREKLLRLTQVASNSDSIRVMLRGWRKLVLLSSGTETYAIVLDGERAHLQAPDDRKPDLTFELSEKTLDALLAGVVTPLGAKLKGDIRSSGSIIDILRFASLLTTAAKLMKSSVPALHPTAEGS